MTTISVGFDGMIHRLIDGLQDGSIYDEPVRGVWDALHILMDQYAVFVMTDRVPCDVGRWIRENGGIETAWYTNEELLPQYWTKMGVLLVTRRKLPAAMYIESRGLRFDGDWLNTLDDIKRLMS